MRKMLMTRVIRVWPKPMKAPCKDCCAVLLHFVIDQEKAQIEDQAGQHRRKSDANRIG